MRKMSTPIAGIGLLKRIDDFDSFSAVRSISEGSISEQVIAAVRRAGRKDRTGAVPTNYSSRP